MISLKRILVPTDFSDYSSHAITYGCEIAKRFASELQLLYVAEPLRVPAPYTGIAPEPMPHPEEPGKKTLEELEHPGLDQVSRVERVYRTGEPFVEIVRHARENGVDLIVMGTHGRTGLMHALIGSVAERVVRKSSCPVLTVRPQGHQFVMP